MCGRVVVSPIMPQQERVAGLLHNARLFVVVQGMQGRHAEVDDCRCHSVVVCVAAPWLQVCNAQLNIVAVAVPSAPGLALGTQGGVCYAGLWSWCQWYPCCVLVPASSPPSPKTRAVSGSGDGRLWVRGCRFLVRRATLCLLWLVGVCSPTTA
jgi:hypothetical protein